MKSTQPSLLPEQRYCSFCGESTTQPPLMHMEVCQSCADGGKGERVRVALGRWGRR